jgi:rubrerythrin
MTWSLSDIRWDQFSSKDVPNHLVPIIKAASLVEYNSFDYGCYLKNVFKDDPLFFSHIDRWVYEEEQHGRALGKWASMVDPDFNIDQAVTTFRNIFRVPLDAEGSIRGSQPGELMARCIVETGTSSFYTAMADSTQEPVLKQICRLIASDEWRHYKLFYTHLNRHLKRLNLSRGQRIRIALSRIKESESDELASAYYAANQASLSSYCHKKLIRLCLGQSYGLYKSQHIHKACQMIAKASGLSPQSRWLSILGRLFFIHLKAKGKVLRAMA